MAEADNVSVYRHFVRKSRQFSKAYQINSSDKNVTDLYTNIHQINTSSIIFFLSSRHHRQSTKTERKINVQIHFIWCASEYIDRFSIGVYNLFRRVKIAFFFSFIYTFQNCGVQLLNLSQRVLFAPLSFDFI